MHIINLYQIKAASSRKPTLHQNFAAIIAKVRKFFKRSPTKNDEVLQKHVKSQFHKEITLLSDCKTRLVLVCLSISYNST